MCVRGDGESLCMLRGAIRDLPAVLKALEKRGRTMMMLLLKINIFFVLIWDRHTSLPVVVHRAQIRAWKQRIEQIRRHVETSMLTLLLRLLPHTDHDKNVQFALVYTENQAIRTTQSFDQHFPHIM